MIRNPNKKGNIQILSHETIKESTRSTLRGGYLRTSWRIRQSNAIALPNILVLRENQQVQAQFRLKYQYMIKLGIHRCKQITAAFMHSLYSKGSKVRYGLSLKLLMKSVETFRISQTFYCIAKFIRSLPSTFFLRFF